MTNMCKSIICCLCICCCMLLAIVSVQNSSLNPFASEEPESEIQSENSKSKDSNEKQDEPTLLANLDSIDYIPEGLSSYPGTSTGPGVLNGYNSTPLGYYNVDVVGNKQQQPAASEIFYNPNKF